jgi:hypothetical protein
MRLPASYFLPIGIFLAYFVPAFQVLSIFLPITSLQPIRVTGRLNLYGRKRFLLLPLRTISIRAACRRPGAAKNLCPAA